MAGFLLPCLIGILHQAEDEKRIRDKFEELSTQLKSAKTPEGLTYLAEQFLALADEAEFADLYEASSRTLGQADRIAKGLKSQDLAERIQQRSTDSKAKAAEFTKAKGAQKILVDKPEDPTANLSLGRYLCFIKGRWEEGLSRLEKGSDEDLKKLAQMELQAGSSGQDKDTEVQLALADAWWPKNRDRAADWYQKAWLSLNPLQKERARSRLKENQARKSATRPVKELPAGWRREAAEHPSVLWDETYARTGRFSIRFEPPTSKDVGYSGLASRSFPSSHTKKYRLSAWVLTEGNTGEDYLNIVMFDAAGKTIGTRIATAPVDTPFWTRIDVLGEMLPDTASIDVRFQMKGKSGKVWMDDISLREVDRGAELLENVSFERR